MFLLNGDDLLFEMDDTRVGVITINQMMLYYNLVSSILSCMTYSTKALADNLSLCQGLNFPIIPYPVQKFSRPEALNL